MRRTFLIALLALVLAAGYLALSPSQGSKAKPPKMPVDPTAELVCYVGGTMRSVMEELVDLYQKKTGRKVALDFGDSGTLISKIETRRSGDLYVCHDPFLASLFKKDLGDQGWVVASLTPMIAVPKGNPKKILGLQDLARPGLKVGLTDAEYSTAGHIVALMLRKAYIEDKVLANVAMRARSGGEVANAVGLGAVDAGIVWDAVIFERQDKLDAVGIAADFRPRREVDAVTSATYGRMEMDYVKVTIASLKFSRQIEAARAFAAFVASPESAAVFVKFGFTAPDPARPWKPEDTQAGAAATPAAGALPAATEKTGSAQSLLLYCGAGLRPPLAEAAQVFGQETGIKVECDFAGSDALLSKARLSRRGDLFLPGDEYYAKKAEEDGLLRSRQRIGFFVPVILVQKGNPKAIQSLRDLTRPGLQVGLGDAKVCAIGRQSALIFEKNGIKPEDYEKSVVFRSLTVNELANHIKVGKLDATIVWDATAAQYPDAADAVPIPLAENLVSPLEIGVLMSSVAPEAAERFCHFLTSERGKGLLRKHHYLTESPQGAAAAASLAEPRP